MIRGIVYVGGGDTPHDGDRYLIQQYSPTDDRWYTLPPAPVKYFGMGELNEQLVIVGGRTRQRDVTGKVHTLNSSTQKWVESIAPMPTARSRPAVLSLPSCLTVVGGGDQRGTHLSDVEIFMPHTSQWHSASPAPSPLYNMITTVINNKCFIASYGSTIVYQLCVSLHQTTTDTSNTPQVITEWTNLCDLPHEWCGLGSINGCLLAVGGVVGWPNPITTILGYSPITNTWKTVGELPEPRRDCTTVLLPTGELLVMGGWDRPLSHTNKVWRAAIV